MNIEELKNQLLKNQNIMDVEFVGYNDEHPEFLITFYDGIKENWEIRENDGVYYYDKNEDEWMHIYRLSANNVYKQ